MQIMKSRKSKPRVLQRQKQSATQVLAFAILLQLFCSVAAFGTSSSCCKCQQYKSATVLFSADSKDGATNIDMSGYRHTSPQIHRKQLILDTENMNNRRKTIGSVIAASAVFITAPWASHASDTELPLFLRDYTKLAPLGEAQVFNNKRQLSLSQLAEQLQHDLVAGANNKGGYVLSGDIDTTLFRDDCVFVDPTNRVNSLSQYQNALKVLFDADRSTISMVEPLTVNNDDYTITGKFASSGFLKFPWHPYITPYESTIVYAIDPENGLVKEQRQEWSKSAAKALLESFTPAINRYKSAK